MKKKKPLLYLNFLSIYCCLLTVPALAQLGWQTQPSGTSNELMGVHFVDNNTGWVVGAYDIIKTSDGGTNWTKQISGTTAVGLLAVHFTDASTGWTVGSGGNILKTTNGGTSWIPQTSGTLNALWSVYFTNSSTGWAVGDTGTIIHTTDGGVNWVAQNSGTNIQLRGVQFTGVNTGWAVGYKNEDVILKTTDGGANWNQQFTGTMEEWLVGLHFSDSNTGYLVGLSGTVTKTSDGGTSWTAQTNFASLRCVYFTDSDTGWVAGYNGKILKTTDGGASWIAQTSGTVKILSDVFFANPNSGWAVGEDGIILHTVTGGEEIQGSPEYGTGIINAVYPNPLEANSLITFELPEGVQEGEIIITDLSGKKVKRYDVETTTGYVRISTLDLAKGTYYYSMYTSNGRSAGREMVKIH